MTDVNTDINSLIAKRGIIKGQLTRFTSFIQNFNENKPLAELKKRLQVVEENILKDFNAVQSSIELLDPEQGEERNEFENKYFETVARAENVISNTILPPVGEISNQSDSMPLNNTVKLPTIQLPTFQGSYEKWLEYHDTFDSLIHKNKQINDIQKFHYLKSTLVGEPLQIISGLEATTANYQVAWTLLCERYDNKRLLVHNHIKSIFNLKSIANESSIQLRQLIDNINKHMRALKSLGQPTEHWDTLIIFQISSKLDSETSRQWEAHRSENEVPTLQNIISFLKDRADLLETLASNNPKVFKTNKGHNQDSNKAFVSATQAFKCKFCKADHKIYNCNEFLKLPISARIEQVKKLNLCLNCLNGGHSIRECRFGACKKCNSKHNSLLHYDNTNPSTNTGTPNETVSLSSYIANKNQILLSTAIIQVQDSHGDLQNCRVLLDCASQSNYITDELCNVLGLDKVDANVSVVGISQISSFIKSKCEIRIHSRHNAFSASLSCLVIPEICGVMPGCEIDISSLDIPKNIFLADPGFYKPSKIDMLIGASLFWQLLCVGQIKLGANKPIFHKTKFGWVISGPLEVPSNNISYCNLSREIDIQQQLSKFWEIEECPVQKSYSAEEKACEAHFVSTFQRDSNGRFIVTIPFKDSLSKLGESKQIAQRRFYSLERKFQSNAPLRERYVDFINEFQTLGHMSESADNVTSGDEYFFPHHGVIKEDSSTTKLRVVFNGSCPTSSGVSLNDLQMVGPTLQSDLLAILLRFRQHSYVVASDICKMYRQVLVTPTQRPLQSIVWRSNPSNPLRTFHINTVTYGTAAASFLAIRCLQQLSYENAEKHSVASRIIAEDFYVDDMLTGAETVEEAYENCQEVSDILKQGGFILRKWLSNDPQIIKDISDSNFAQTLHELGDKENTKTLGLIWSCQTDCLAFHISISDSQSQSTKRSMLSAVAQIYDPLGLLSACIITTKIMLQQLWAEKLGWDDSISLDLHTKWIKFRDELLELNNLQIPRHVKCQKPVKVIIHCFCDASLVAYGSATYIQSISELGHTTVNLLCAKSRVSPIKSLTMPRLELCGALVASQLYDKVTRSLSLHIDDAFFWTDSTIVLAWVKTPPNLLKTFVSNRVSEIQTKTDQTKWFHVSSSDNPADLLSRGVNPILLKSCDFWWHGPPWLSKGFNAWPEQSVNLPNEIPETRTTLTMVSQIIIDFPFQRFSNLTRLQRCVAYCIRFSSNCKLPKNARTFGPLTTDELQEALLSIVKIVQQQCFHSERMKLARNATVSRKSKIRSLNPFLDSNGIIRVGGRLKNSQFEYSKKYPIVIPNGHHFTKLIFRHEHLNLFHAGPQHLLASVRERFWPIFGKNIAKKTVHNCVKCFRAKPSSVSPIMGNLPAARTQESPPFYVTGVDYAGPFYVKDRKGRGCKTSKAYISLFVCFSTKALHLELVSSLSTPTFLAALRRFISRRGIPSSIWSDNGTNFVGASNELHNLGQFLLNTNNEIKERCAVEGIRWNFIPAYSPHFGGLWEAGVKSTKSHLKRIMANASLTFEDFATLLAQVEAILNSRPLSPLSSDPRDLNPLTPSHFLIGRPLTSIPEPDLTETKENRLTKFQRIQQLFQHFWRRWYIEYIGELQTRCKWKESKGQLNVGAMVLIKIKNQPPLSWPIGRVQELHPGPDGTSRVATILTSTGAIQRAVTNVCPLPLEG